MIFLVCVASSVMTPGGRHGDDRRNAGRVGPHPPIADILEIPHRPRLPRHEGNDLAGIERAAATEGDDAVMMAAAQHGDAVLDIPGDGITAQISEDRRRHAGLFVRCDRIAHHRHASEPGIGDEQRPLYADGLASVGQLGDTTDAESHARRVIPVAAQRLGGELRVLFGHVVDVRK